MSLQDILILFSPNLHISKLLLRRTTLISMHTSGPPHYYTYICRERCYQFRRFRIDREIPLYIVMSLVLGGWNREISLYTEMSSVFGVIIERFHFI